MKSIVRSSLVILLAVAVLGCGNFLGRVGESFGGDDTPKKEREKGQRPSTQSQPARLNLQ